LFYATKKTKEDLSIISMSNVYSNVGNIQPFKTTKLAVCRKKNTIFL